MSLLTFGIKIVIYNLEFGKYWVNLVHQGGFSKKIEKICPSLVLYKSWVTDKRSSTTAIRIKRNKLLIIPYINKD